LRGSFQMIRVLKSSSDREGVRTMSCEAIETFETVYCSNCELKREERNSKVEDVESLP
jgi:hypothetical protein